jgi:hypothetical protein
MSLNAIRGALVVLVVIVRCATAELIEYDYQEREEWFADAGALNLIETITFTEHPLGPLTTQYEESHGMVETSLGLVQIFASEVSYPHDGRGMLALATDAILEFDHPMQALAADFPGLFIVEFYWNESFLGSAQFEGLGGPGNFSGVISTTPFNRVVMSDSDSDFSVDDLHLVAVPAPPILLAFAGGLALLGRGRRRRGASGAA